MKRMQKSVHKKVGERVIVQKSVTKGPVQGRRRKRMITKTEDGLDTTTYVSTVPINRRHANAQRAEWMYILLHVTLRYNEDPK